MARPLRARFEGAHYHLLAKGNRDQYIFSEAKDRDFFIDRLARAKEKYSIEIFAYCILGNHYHLLVQTLKANLPEFMHYLGSTYGTHLSRNNWKGHVFNGRYRSFLVTREEYLMTLSRYIHLNPVTARIVHSPEDYPWSSYIYYSGKQKPPSWLNTEWVADYFGPSKYALERYREFVLAGIGGEIRDPDNHVIGQAILESEDFVEKIISKVADERVAQAIDQRRKAAKEISLGNVLRAVCAEYGLRSLRKPGLEPEYMLREGRAAFIFIAKEHTSASNREIAEFIGNIGESAVSQQFRRINIRLEEDDRFRCGFRARIGHIRERIDKDADLKG
jgi:REP element-mobilizing transposase RayT